MSCATYLPTRSRYCGGSSSSRRYSRPDALSVFFSDYHARCISGHLSKHKLGTIPPAPLPVLVLLVPLRLPLSFFSASSSIQRSSSWTISLQPICCQPALSFTYILFVTVFFIFILSDCCLSLRIPTQDHRRTTPRSSSRAKS